LREHGDDRIESIKKYVGLLPEHLVRRFVDKTDSAVLITGRLPDVDASQILPVVEKLDRALDEVRRAHPGYKIAVTGLPAIAARNSSGMIKQLNEALAIEVVMVSILLGIAFRSLFVGAISFLPGLFPVVAAGAVLALMGEGLEFASVVALIIIFGLGVDGLIHFLNRLRLEDRPGEDPALAIRRARVLVGPAIILTTVVLTFGLGVTMFSDLPSLRLFGRVCAITLAASLIADLVFLPATIMLWRRLFPAGTTASARRAATG
jgi:predicted RND superfamily exporter protein